MEIPSKLLSFADLYAAVHLLDPANLYEKQDELRAYCRSAGKPFLYQIPVRHRFNCEVCGIQTGEAYLHFEDPSQPLGDIDTSPDPHPPVGYFCPINYSELHGILAHGKAMPTDLQELFSRVRT